MIMKHQVLKQSLFQSVTTHIHLLHSKRCNYKHINVCLLAPDLILWVPSRPVVTARQSQHSAVAIFLVD